MKRAKTFLDLTNEEVKQIVTDIFSCERVTNIKRDRKYDEITCNIYTEWHSTNDKGEDEYDVVCDELTLKNPFDYGEDAIHVDFSVRWDDYKQLKQFCFAKGIYGREIDFLFDNPYMEEKEEEKEEEVER